MKNHTPSRHPVSAFFLGLGLAMLVACTSPEPNSEPNEEARVQESENGRVANEGTEIKTSNVSGDDAEQGLIEVTGSRIKRVDAEGPSPVSVITREDIDSSGDITIADAIRSSKHGSIRQNKSGKKPSRDEDKQRAAQVLASQPLAYVPQSLVYPPPYPQNRENYAHIDTNPLRLTSEHPVSTFSIDVDTASYANVRRFLNQGSLPPEDAVRVEELINYFAYDYPQPEDETPFGVYTEVAPAPWDQESALLLVGIEGLKTDPEERPDANLVFLIDVSGSMQSPDKLPLLRKSFKLLVKRMNPNDRIAMVVYAGSTGVVLDSTAGDEKRKILSALSQLQAGGSTNGGAGIELAYSIAADNYIDGGINRVVLATDGDFNVGTVNFESLIDMVERRRASGISLTTLGFGTGNINDKLLEQLADKGNGNYAYIDSLKEAKKVLVEELSATLQTIAADVKIQIEFNPQRVAEYRLIGYENRMLKREDFNNDKIDAGEVGAGHSVTALYELRFVGSENQLVDPLRYGQRFRSALPEPPHPELALLRLRYKTPGEDRSKLIESPVMANDMISLRHSSENFRFAASVAAFGQTLRGAEYLQDFRFEEILDLARGSRGNDNMGYRAEFIGLVSLAQALSEDETQASL